MKKLHLLIIKSYIGPLVLTFFIALFILLMQFLWKYIDELVGKGLSWEVITELMIYASASLVPMALPLGILLASLMTFGNLGENYELVALKSAGISLPRIFSPLIILTLIICIAAFFFSNDVLPYTNLKMGTLLFDIRQKQPEVSIPEGVFYNGIENYSIKVEHKDDKRKMMYDIMIYDHTSHRGNISVIVADSGKMTMTSDMMFMMVKLYHGYSASDVIEERKVTAKRTYPFRRDYFAEQQLIFKLSGNALNRSDEGLFKKHYQMLNLQQLTQAEDSLELAFKNRKQSIAKNLLVTNYFKHDDRKANHYINLDYQKNYKSKNIDSVNKSLTNIEKRQVIDLALNYARSTKSYITTYKEDLLNRSRWIKRHQIEWHRKFSLSFACFVLFFIGAPFGAIIRKGGFGMPVVISMIFFILYYMLSITGEKFVREDVWSAFLGMWISAFILLPIGVFLTYKASTDSALINIDNYFDSIKEFFEKKIRNKRSKSFRNLLRKQRAKSALHENSTTD